MIPALAHSWQVLATVLVVLWLAPQAAYAQKPVVPSPNPLDDPVVHGAWMYQGNCTRRHGVYAEDRVGRGLDADELEQQIAGSVRDGCQVDWAAARAAPSAIARSQRWSPMS